MVLFTVLFCMLIVGEKYRDAKICAQIFQHQELIQYRNKSQLTQTLDIRFTIHL